MITIYFPKQWSAARTENWFWSRYWNDMGYAVWQFTLSPIQTAAQFATKRDRAYATFKVL